MKVSVVIPSKGCKYLNYLLLSLGRQTIKPHEVILVVKDCDVKEIEKICLKYGLPCIIVEQKEGFVTAALNRGKREASGDIVLFTDDDALAPKGWIERYVKAFCKAPRDVGCISSRDVYVMLNGFKITATKDDFPQTKLYRWFIRTWFEPPLDVLREYRFGVYVTKRLSVVHGPYLPDRATMSLPYRGVNMGFRSEGVDAISFPEHPRLRRAIGYEQYVGLQLIFDGWRSIYIPTNPILHIFREKSLSRGINKREIKDEEIIMKSFFIELLKQKGCEII